MRAPVLALVAFLILLAGFGAFLCRRSADLKGVVTDAAGPAAGATVRIKGTAQVVLTDESGRFELPPPIQSGATITASKEGYFISGSRTRRSPLALILKPLPRHDCAAYAWVEPAPDPSGRHNCGNCHGEIYREWSAGGHASSARNRRFLNLYDGTDWLGRPDIGWNLLAQHPDGAGVCTACHAPTVPFNDPAYYDLRKVHGVAASGVHCDYCHKIADVDNTKIGQTHGRFGLKLLRPAEGQLFFGPLDDVDRGEDAHASVYQESRYCASCHEGTVFGVHVYGTYSEWLASPARKEGKQCQTCHMVPTGTLTNLAPGKGGIDRDPATLASHRFPGGNSEMLRRCLKVSVVLTPGPSGCRADVAVRAENAGHRVPTGFVDRNLLLVVEPLGKNGQRLEIKEGPQLPPAAGKTLAGLPGRIFAKLLKDKEGHGPLPFWQAPAEIVDTRLFPDRVEHTVFRLPSEVAEVRLRLIYRRFWQEVAESKRWPENEIVLIDKVLRPDPRMITRWSGP